ncbi:HMCN2 [Branchiostoma lanceolatum]|uniref:HMCN2 protein n=1 Tax=Branchiostoma lanceolatum TaxID=7740 RepID=A0A8J9WI35_BRALA|nr:HMCN2 [Branchiostoma lanceolatum]
MLFVYLLLFITEPPRVVVGPEDPYVVQFNTTVTLTCSVSGAKPNITSLHWRKNGMSVNTLTASTAPGYRKYLGGNGADPNLRLRNAGKDDAGMYTCVADHEARQGRASLKLEVLYPPTIIHISGSLTMASGDSVKLYCRADGYPKPVIRWLKEGLLLPTDLQTSTGEVSMMTLSNLNINDSGQYACSASNDVGSADAKTLRLTVQDMVARQSSGKKGSSTRTAIIAGAVAGGLWLLLCLVLLIIWARRRRERLKKRARNPPYYSVGMKEFDYYPRGRQSIDKDSGAVRYLTDSHSDMGKGRQSIDKDSGAVRYLTDSHSDMGKGRQSIDKDSGAVRYLTDSHSDMGLGATVPLAVEYNNKRDNRKSGDGDSVTWRRFAKVLYTYVPTDEDELRLQSGDVVEVLKGEGGGWWYGKLNGKAGLFPSNYVEIINLNETLRRKGASPRPKSHPQLGVGCRDVSDNQNNLSREVRRGSREGELLRDGLRT